TRDVLAALDGAYLGYELLDSRYREYRFALPDVIADNTSAAGFCLGHVDVLSHWGRIGLEGIVVRKNGEVVQTGVPAASLGDPIFAVMRLANELARFGRWLEPGMVILTGGVTQSVPIAPGDEFEMSWRFER